jgi:hypothetical protein
MSKQRLFYQRLDILEFIRHPQVLNDNSLSPGQTMCLKIIYGLPLDETEHALYVKATGHEEYIPKEVKEFTALCGRRSGKTSRVGAAIVCYEAFRNHGLRRGERAYVLLIAPVLDQAQIGFRYVCAYINCSAVLRKKVRKITRDEIELKNGVVIACWPCSSVTVRGLSVITAVLDEVAYWPNDDTSANSLESVLSALRPATITFPLSKIIKLTTPAAKLGLIWEEYQRRDQLDFPVVQLSSVEMNPQLDPSALEIERQRDEQTFRSEYRAEFVDSIDTWINPEILGRCIVSGRRELPYLAGRHYVAVVDPAFRHSDFGLAILHQQDDLVVVDRIAVWQGTKQVPVAFDRVCSELRDYLGEFQIGELYGDQYCVEPLRQQFMKLGLMYQEFLFTRRSRQEIFLHLRYLINERRIELLDHAESVKQLRGLEECRESDGSIDIRPRYSLKDDLAICVALGALQLSKQTQPLPISMGRASRPWDGRLPQRISQRPPLQVYLDPDTCHLAGDCKNWKPCVEAERCLGYVPSRT